jgi:glycosyltransferase involved in cell wall biosynthesis
MRIAQIAGMAESVPPKKYGGTERVISALTEELVLRGHDVTLFATGDSETTAKLVSVLPRGSREAKINDNLSIIRNVGLVFKRQKEFDVIHSHVEALTLPLADLSQTPVIITMHGPLTRENRRLFQEFTAANIVTISESQGKNISGINHAGVVYNGLEMEHYPFGGNPEDYLLFVGRISNEKGVHLAIDAAQMVDLPLVIAAKLDDVDLAYYEEYIRPRLSKRIRWVGEVTEEERNELMSKARCFLHPATWREPFGLTLIEAMACGCPVVAFGRGSIPEIIENGVTGFVVDDLDGMAEAIEAISGIDRQVCRDYALSRFNAKIMTDKYEEIYRRVTKESA